MSLFKQLIKTMLPKFLVNENFLNFFGSLKQRFNNQDFGILSTDISLRAPEHIQKPQFSFEADIWAYGCLLFQIFSYGDEELYSSTNEEEIKEAIRKGNFPKPKQVWPQVIQKIITECLNINPYARITFDKIVIDLGNTKMKEPLPLSNQRNSLIELPTKA